MYIYPFVLGERPMFLYPTEQDMSDRYLMNPAIYITLL